MKPGQKRRKGHAWEREVARLFREVMPGCVSKRGLQYADPAAPDVQHPWLFVECKHGKRPQPKAALEQAERGLRSAKLQGLKSPIAICKWDGQPAEKAMVSLRLGDFLDLMSELWDGRK